MNRPSLLKGCGSCRAAVAAGVCAILFCSAVAAPTAEAERAEAAYQIVAKRASDQVTVQGGGERVVFVVESRTGIGRAEITRRDASWPATVVIRLALRGLEDFRLKAGDTELGIAVSSHGEGDRVRAWRTSEERAALAADDPLCPQVRLLDARGKPTGKGPPEIAAIEIVLPSALLKNQPQSIEFSWIDFFR